LTLGAARADAGPAVLRDALDTVETILSSKHVLQATGT
jgi:hypothetical protein